MKNDKHYKSDTFLPSFKLLLSFVLNHWPIETFLDISTRSFLFMNKITPNIKSIICILSATLFYITCIFQTNQNMVLCNTIINTKIQLLQNLKYLLSDKVNPKIEKKYKFSFSIAPQKLP